MKKETSAPEVQGTEVEAPKKLNKKERRALKAAEAKAQADALLAQSKEAEKAKAETADEKPKKKKSDKQTLKDESANGVVAKITEEKELKYIYPEDCSVGKTKLDILEKRKKFRAGVRRKVESLTKAVKKIADEMIVLEADPEKNKKALKTKKAEMKTAEENYTTYAKEVYVKGELQEA